jgi:hypothetical protein
MVKRVCLSLGKIKPAFSLFGIWMNGKPYGNELQLFIAPPSPAAKRSHSQNDSRRHQSICTFEAIAAKVGAVSSID